MPGNIGMDKDVLRAGLKRRGTSANMDTQDFTGLQTIFTAKEKEFKRQETQ